MKTIKNTILLLALSLGAVSCNQYLDINENPNAAHIEDITPAFVFPGAASEIHRIQTAGDGSMMHYGSLMANNWGSNVYAFSGFFSREFNLSTVDASFYSGIWSTIYFQSANLKLIEEYPNADHKQDYYVAMAKILKAFYMQYIVDLYGDAPYSDAFGRGLNTKPKYDDDKEIYKALINDIDNGIALINAGNIDAISPGGTDVIFGGNMTNWKAFANTIKLRMLLRMSNVTGDMATFRDAKLATLPSSTAAYITQNVVVNPGYSNATAEKMNPFLAAYRISATALIPQAYNQITASEHIALALNGNRFGSVQPYSSNPIYTKFNNITDPRSTRLFTAINYQGFPQVKGVRQGASSGDPGAPLDVTTVSKFGTGTFAGSTTVTSNAQLISAGNARGGMIMSLAEAKFLQAEAALRYPSLFSGGSARFEEGIDASGVWLGANMATYKTQIATREGLGWTGSNTQILESIMTQKWLALANVSPIESFLDFLRTGYPATPMPVGASVANKPYRLMYPITEFSANSENVPNITSAQLFVKNQYTPFWNQN
ncbi:SusD/RagB family nutrient-binding outer membrane lipoprotein [Chryseobacterium sp. SSA4.19]|uniref:SusD/RagB family nutrient-binding outer membrane lipoprotein n=1 Tax=Chryseobacterium sp. SSA4.19 TaxID=2919915 RepID=UPI001F4D5070|nr:SusD/RagB family nutrient-binding outer membrane lipoprotein [Chryseobacterium sp. SSA4.19]MCJ8155152.1 SusD/RagB family nutrient-binding outer membrane lipoprotein [Chryseobacterium sp. SSA4.19]